MHSRVSRYEIPPDKIDAAIEAFREAGPALAALDGGLGGYLLVDRESGTALTVTFWENAAVLDASDARAAALRQRAVEPADGCVQAVEKYEVAVDFSRER